LFTKKNKSRGKEKRANIVSDMGVFVFSKPIEKRELKKFNEKVHNQNV